MTALLRIDASPRREKSHSRRMANEMVESLMAACPGMQVIDRDLGAEAAPAIDERYVDAMASRFTREQSATAAELAMSEAFIGELERTDMVLISTPVHNYTVPASLKAWIDHVVRVGRTFRPTETGKVGLLKDRPTFVVAASGGYFSSTAARQPDFFTPYLNAILKTIGICNVHHVRLEGCARGEAAIEAARQKARTELAAIVAKHGLAGAL